MMIETYPAAIEETPEMYASRTTRTFHLGLLSLAGFGFLGLILYMGNYIFSTYLPETFPLSPGGALIVVIVTASLGLGWVGILSIFFAAWRAVPVRFTDEGIQMPRLPFLRWLAGERLHLVGWDEIRLVHLFERSGNRWWIVLADGDGRKYGFGGGWFGGQSDLALRILREKVTPFRDLKGRGKLANSRL